MNTKVFIVAALAVVVGGVAPAAIAQEVLAIDAVDAIVDDVTTDFAPEVASMGGREVLEADIETYANDFGIVETRAVFETIGPDAVGVMNDVPANFKAEAFSFMAQDGRDSLYVLSSSTRLEIFQADGLPAAEAMARYPGIAQDAISQDGLPAAEAINALDPTDATRLDAMIDDGSLAKEGDAPTLLDRIAKGGDKTFAAIWKNRAGLLKLTAVVGVGGVAMDFLGHVGHAVSSAVSGVGAAITAVRKSPAAAFICLMVLTGVFLGILVARKAIGMFGSKLFRQFKALFTRRRHAAPAAANKKPSPLPAQPPAADARPMD